MASDPTNPDVQPASPWQWSAFFSMVLVTLEEVGTMLAGWESKPKWLVIVAASIPWVVRLGRRLLGLAPVSFRATKTKE